jgi:ABC-type transport system involved in multi-copper enzyme maturation permease subunit
MKALAIFYDSLREALDTKVLYFTVGLSVLLVFLVASVAFRPVPPLEQMENIASILGMVGSMQQTDEQYGVADFRQTNDASDPWNGDYSFIWIVRIPKERMTKPGTLPSGVKQQHYDQISSDATTRVFIEGAGPGFLGVDVGKRQEVELTNDPNFIKEYRFPVTTHGTRIKDRRGWIHETSLFFGALPLSVLQSSLGKTVEFIVDDLIGTFGSAVTMLLSCIITAFFIPNMLRKGTIDLLLVKPIHRTSLLIYKFLGGLTFMFLNTAIILVGFWLVIGLRSGLWVNGLLLCVFIFTFQFAIFYAVSALMGVLTGSPIVCILASIGTWVILIGVGWGYRWHDATRPDKAVEEAGAAVVVEQGGRPRDQSLTGVRTALEVAHFVLPHYKDLDVLVTRLLRHDLLDAGSPQIQRAQRSVSSINWPESIGITVAFIGLMLGLGCWRFARRDY